MAKDEWSIGASDLARWLDQQPIDFAEAHIKLIDALRDYVRSNDEFVQDLINEEQLTAQDAKKWELERRGYLRMKEQLEAEHCGYDFAEMLKKGTLP